ncbi:GntR family transcriptional regulator [Actinokineospora baliensis]|uniref:GntR family transcriptional regulator n=1 Tax=Actinokineospora baliensis TaxID=547056 RepID=UPI00195D9570|nr:GntR family transcriptional regulator [Actinokineospora baliensis]MBM7776272.1 GntR family transcriptional regulator [Actinokineospora baliensis]
MPREDETEVKVGVNAADIARDLRGAITRGEYQPGDRLPGENNLMQQYGVARMTARTAVSTLQNEGLAVAHQGRGVFVRERRHMQRHGTERYARSRWQKAVLGAEAAEQNRKASRVVRLLATVPAPEKVAQRLALPADTPVWTRQRLVFLDDHPIQIADSYYPLDVVERSTLRETEPGSSDFAQLDAVGHTPTRIREEWSARMPSPDEVSALSLLPGTPVLEFVRTITDQTGRPVEVMLSLIAADSAEMVYDFPVPD